MRRTILALVGACALALGGCVTTGSTTGSTTTVDASTLAGELKGGIQTACGFQVTADTALQLAGLAASPFVLGSGALAAFLQATVDGVCATVKAPPASAAMSGPARAAVRAMAPPVYRGVPIKAQ